MVKVLRKENFSEDEIHWTFKQERTERNIEEMSHLDWPKLYADYMFFAFILISTVGKRSC